MGKWERIHDFFTKLKIWQLEIANTNTLCGMMIEIVTGNYIQKCNDQGKKHSPTAANKNIRKTKF